MKQLINSEGREVSKRAWASSPDAFCEHCNNYWFHPRFPTCWNCQRTISIEGYKCNEVVGGKLIDSRPAVLEDFK